jgi:hypothetical protein
MWILPKNLPEKYQPNYIGKVKGHACLKAYSENAMYRGEFKPLTSWTRSRKDYTAIKDRVWYSHLDERVVVNAEQVKRYYIDSLPRVVKTEQISISLKRPLFSDMDHASYEVWQDTVMRKRLDVSRKYKNKLYRNSVYFYISKSEFSDIRPKLSYSVKFLESAYSDRDWSDLETGIVVESLSFKELSSRYTKIWRTPLKGTDLRMSSKRSLKHKRLKEDPTFKRSAISNFTVFDEVAQSMDSSLDPYDFEINTRWVETLMGLPIGMVNPESEYLVDNVCGVSPHLEWRNNG